MTTPDLTTRLVVERDHVAPAPEPKTPRRLLAIRVAAIAAAAATTLYLGWRIVATLTWETAILGVPLLAAELYALATLVLFTILLWDIRRLPRPARREASELTVDVVIPTYSEPWEVLLPTVAAARALPLAREVWVLDDGDRDWVRDLCEELGCRYRRRDGNADAKAGNINAALPDIDADLIAVFDADHVAHTEFIRRTIGYFDDPGIALVQTPQDFYNMESFEHIADDDGAVAFADQDVFYRVIGPGRNAAGAVFWCGTNAILRMDALRDVGGVAQGTVTEDIHTSVRLQQRGWRTVYHNEVLARGLAADDAEQYLAQRVRWGTGTMQLLRSADNPLLDRRLRLGQRLGYWSTVLGWFDGWRALVLMLLSPAVLLTGLSPVAGPVLPFVVLFVASFLLQRFAIALLGRGRGPIIRTSLFEVIRLPAMLAVTTTLFIKGTPRFTVTHKGRRAERIRVDAPRVLVVLLALILLGLVVGVAIVLLGGPIAYDQPLMAASAAIWGVLNAALLIAAIRRITHERYAGERRASVRFAVTGRALLDGAAVHLRDVSLTGARLEAPAGSAIAGSTVQVRVDGVDLAAEVRAVEAMPEGREMVRVRFDDGDRRRLADLALALFRTGSRPHVDWQPA